MYIQKPFCRRCSIGVGGRIANKEPKKGAADFKSTRSSSRIKDEGSKGLYSIRNYRIEKEKWRTRR